MTLCLQLPVSRGYARFWDSYRYVQPVISRRFGGLALEINLAPDRTCNLNCVYCNIDKSVARPAMDLTTLDEELDALLPLCSTEEIFDFSGLIDTSEHLRRFTNVVLSGTGEPTSYAHFGEAISIITGLIQRHRVSKPIVLQTNATLLHRRPVAEGVQLIEENDGELWCKLDAGSEELFNKVVRAAVPIARVMSNIAQAGRRRPVVIQSMFFKLDGVGPSEDEIQAYLKRLGDLQTVGCRIRRVRIHTLSERARERCATAVDEETIDRIAGRVRGMGLNVSTFYATD